MTGANTPYAQGWEPSCDSPSVHRCRSIQVWGRGYHPQAMIDGPVRFATRGSRLALAQAESVKHEVESHRHTVELVEVSTTGDELDDTLIHELGTTGAFVRALDQEVLDESVHGAIHSMKDVPTDNPESLVIAAIPPRGPSEDVLVTPAGDSLTELPDGATVGTASLRRRAQVLNQRSDLEVEPVRGNVDTRLVKLYATAFDREEEPVGPTGLLERAQDREVETEYDALVLAKAGLQRAGFLDEIQYATLPVPTAPGQGAIAINTLDNDFGTWLNELIDDPRSRVETTVERCILATLGGGCIAPIAVDAVIQGEHVQTEVQVLNRDGSETVEANVQLPVPDHVEAAQELAEKLIEQGADELIEAARRDEPSPPHRD